MGWLGFGSDSEGAPPSPAVIQLEQQIEMMDMVFKRYPLNLTINHQGDEAMWSQVHPTSLQGRRVE
jgi:hypothetical protein